MSILTKGLYTALITPFTKDKKIDFNSLEKLLNFQISNNLDGVVLCGTTGEGATLSSIEKLEIAEFSSNIIKNKIKIILNCGTNNTQVSANLAKDASKLNIDGLLAITPYYNKASDKGMFLHFAEIAKNTNLPIILYNVPSRTGIDLKDSIIGELATNFKNIVGIKDATGDLSRISSLRLKVENNFFLFSGEDATSLAFNESGGDGVISVASNIVPNLMLKLQNLSLKDDLNTTKEEKLHLQKLIYKISRILFMEVNPIPVKYLLFLMGLCENEYRLPLCSPSNHVVQEIEKLYQELKFY
jgi:4-hydroxy-tetrahydrodipicolinate synthase